MESTNQGWEAQPRPLSGPIPRSSGVFRGRERGVTARRGDDNRNETEYDGDAVEDDDGGVLDDGSEFMSDASGAVGAKGESSGGAEAEVAGGGGGGGGRRSSGGGFKGDRLVKKTLRLNQLAVYWNPAEDGNPCSMHLSDIPVEQAEVVISRYEARERRWGGRGASLSCAATVNSLSVHTVARSYLQERDETYHPDVGQSNAAPERCGKE